MALDNEWWWPLVSLFFSFSRAMHLSRQVVGLCQTAHVQRGSTLSLSPHSRGRELKGAVGGVPHRARIGRALFHRARSASTGAPTYSPASYTGHFSSFHAISQNIHS